jgi:hypothetical protein
MVQKDSDASKTTSCTDSKDINGDLQKTMQSYLDELDMDLEQALDLYRQSLDLGTSDSSSGLKGSSLKKQWTYNKGQGYRARLGKDTEGSMVLPTIVVCSREQDEAVAATPAFTLFMEFLRSLVVTQAYRRHYGGRAVVHQLGALAPPMAPLNVLMKDSKQ